MIPTWVIYSDISAKALNLYVYLMASRRRVGNGRAEVSRDRLATLLGLANPGQLRRYVNELVKIGAVTVEQVAYANGMRRRNVYSVHYDREEVCADAA